MHQHPKYHEQTDAKTVDFLRARSFGTLCINGDDGPLAMQAPFVLTDGGAALDIHIFRHNPIAKALNAPLKATLVVNGPDGYISPDWYGPGDYVSTWNYVSVQVKGTLAPLPADALDDVLAAQTQAYEARLAPKAPWTIAKMDPAKYEAMKRAIIPLRLTVERIEPTWKLGQEKPDAAKHGAADNLPSGFGSELVRLAAMMRQGGPTPEE